MFLSKWRDHSAKIVFYCYFSLSSKWKRFTSVASFPYSQMKWLWFSPTSVVFHWRTSVKQVWNVPMTELLLKVNYHFNYSYNKRRKEHHPWRFTQSSYVWTISVLLSRLIISYLKSCRSHLENRNNNWCGLCMLWLHSKSNFNCVGLPAVLHG